MPAFSLTGIVGQARNFLSGPFGPLIIVLVIVVVVMVVVIPLVRKLRQKSLKNKETREIMKDLFTWRHLSRLVKGGEDHNKAKEELSDNIVRINELLKQGLIHASTHNQNLYNVPWYVVLGEPRSGKSALLQGSELELLPSEEESNTQDDPKNSLPVRVWTGAKAVLWDISGRVFFDRWLDGSSAEWHYIIRHICRRQRRKALDGIIITIPADALLADDSSLTSKKGILIASEMGKLLRQSGMNLPCYVVVTKLDMVSGFHEYVKAFSGDLRHQILGFENGERSFNEETFGRFWETLQERLRSGAIQLLFAGFTKRDEIEGSLGRMDEGGKIWLFPDNFGEIYKNLKMYLSILFGENDFHGTKNTFFEGVYFTSARELGFSFSPGIASLAGRSTEDVLIPVNNLESEAPEKPAITGGVSTDLVVVNTARSLIAPYLQRTNLIRGYFIRDLLHRRIFVPSPHAEFTRKEALRRHIPGYILCAAMIALGLFWLNSAVFHADAVRMSLMQAESYYNWLYPVVQKGSPARSPLIKEIPGGGFILDNDPLGEDDLSSRLQFYYNTLRFRDQTIPVPVGFRLSHAIVFGFDRNMGYRQKAFIANQFHKSMVRIPVIKNVGANLTEQVDTRILDIPTRNLIESFVSLDHVRGIDFYKFFSSRQFRLDAMIRHLIPDISNDSMELLTSYKPAYDNPHVPQMDVEYIYSPDYRRAKQAALDTVLSAWQRRDVYPDSIYGKIKSLVAISEGITANYADSIIALNRINNVSTFAGVEEAVLEWRRLTDRHKSLAAQGRAIFEDVELLLKAAHIPLAFENTLPSINVDASGISLKKKSLDAFGDNLINDYLFNDMVVSYAVKEYVQLFDADMEFVKQEMVSAVGQVLAEQRTFTGSLNREVADLRRRAQALQNDVFLSEKIDQKPDALSLFLVAERILTLASDIPPLKRETLSYNSFEASWNKGQDNIKTAMDNYEVYVKPYLDNEKLAVLIANARTMLLAEAYYNRYTIFTTSLAFLNTFEGNIAAAIEAQPDGEELFPFSGNAIAGLFGGFYYNKGYNPHALKPILDYVASFASLFGPPEEGKTLPLFLQNADRRIYQPKPFMDYLSSYISYWGAYPDQVYISARTWDHFLARASAYRSFQINSALLSIYVKCLEWVNGIDNSLLTESALALKNKYTASLGDKLALLNQFLSVDAEKMFSSWTRLPADPMEAFAILRSASPEELKSAYLTVYTGGTDTVNIGWWNSFVLDGITILSRIFDETNMNRLIARKEPCWPLMMDAPVSSALSPNTMREIASLLDAMGAAAEDAQPDPINTALRHSLFQGSDVRTWAQTIYQITAAAGDAQKPLTWTIYQTPVETQRALSGGGRLLAIDRFRYMETSGSGGVPRMSSTYMNERLPILQGKAGDEDISFKFYKTSRDKTPGAEIAFNGQWAVFNLYLKKDFIADEKGGVYIPVFLEDEAGKYVYYVEVEFSPELPKSSSWYSSGNWPNIGISSGMITGMR